MLMDDKKVIGQLNSGQLCIFDLKGQIINFIGKKSNFLKSYFFKDS